MTETSHQIGLDEPTLKRFNLSKQPFANPDQSTEFFLPASLKMLIHGIFQQLENEQYLVQVIKGEHGSGKSCLSKIIIADAPSNFIITSINADTQLTTSNILYDVINTSDHTSSQDTQQLAVDAANKIFRLLRNKQQPTVIIDNAHELTQKTLRKMIKFAIAIGHEGFGDLKLILIGERSLEAKLEKLDGSVLPTTRIHNALLRPLNRQDIEAYIRFRFKSARANRKMPLNKKNLEEVLGNCGGLPYKINYLVCELLNKETQSTSRYSNLKKTVPVILFAALLGIMAYYFLPAFDSEPAPEPVQATIDNHQETEDPIVLDDSPIHLLAQNTEADTIVTGDTETHSDSTITAKTDEQLAIAQSPSTGIETTIKNNAEQSAAAETDPKTQSTANNATPIINIEASVSWLLQQPSEYYMLQLAGTWNVEYLYAFAQSLQVSSASHLVLHETVRSDRPWHILLYGPYPGADAAKLATESLPEPLKAGKPWPRSIGSILKTL